MSMAKAQFFFICFVLGCIIGLVYATRSGASTSICTWDIDRYVCQGSSSNVMVGTPEQDMIYGDGHKNVLKGKEQDDYLIGYGRPDKLIGGNGDDLLKGGRGEDHMAAGNGNDTIVAREKGRQATDYVFCGGGYDTVVTVPGGVDYIDPDCEDVVTG